MMMNLREYLFNKRIKISQFARQLEVSRSYLNLVVLDKIKPSKMLAKMIEIETQGEVTAQELLKRKGE